MPKPSLRGRFLPQFNLLLALLRWIPIAGLVGVLAGTASAILLASLTLATTLRESHEWLLLLLAPAGWLMGLLYRHAGRSVEGGNNLILEEVHTPSDTLPARMTPLILLATFLSHLFGASVGREGTALQTGASLADQLARPLRLQPADRRILLMAGVSAGFASVFGTPLAGALFGVEVLAVGTLTYDALAPCVLAAFVGDLTTQRWATVIPGIHHTLYQAGTVPPLSLARLLYAGIAGAVFGLLAMAFVQVTHRISRTAQRLISRPELRPVVGGLLVTAGALALGTTKYLGLGLPTIAAAFHMQLPVCDFAGKFLFTTVSLGSGFKGGEVTPLFFMGATLGNALSHALPLPPALLAAMGFVGVFSGAANTPIASTLMALELYGPEAGAYAGIACVVSYLLSGKAGIYHAQRVGRGKHAGLLLDDGPSTAEAAKLQESVDALL